MEIHPFHLSFTDRQDEAAFRKSFDVSNRIFQRLGLVSGTIWWTFVGLYAMLFYPVEQSRIVVMALLSISPLGAVAFLLTFAPSLHRYYHWFAASMNVVAGGLAVFLGHAVLQDKPLALVSVVAVTFWAFFILRLRFPIAFISALTYVAADQAVLAVHPSYAGRERFLFSLSIWIIYAVCVAAAYTLERTSRTVYAQGKTIESQRNEILEEQAKSEALLLNILPRSIASRLKDGASIIADRHEAATILFADIVGFTTWSADLAPERVVGVLNEIFRRFDGFLDAYGIEKIKTIGDAYMAACGIPIPTEDHAARIARMSLRMLESMRRYNHDHDTQMRIRIGICSGPVVAGVIGERKYLYDLWGDTVNTASRMESHGIADGIQVAESTYSLLWHQFRFEERGIIEIKGKGPMRTYLLKGDV